MHKQLSQCLPDGHPIGPPSGAESTRGRGAAGLDTSGCVQQGRDRVILWLRAPSWRREDARPRTAGHRALPCV